MTRPYIVGSVERGAKLVVVGRYATEGEAKRGMRGAGAGAHVVFEGSLLATHPATASHVETLIARALRTDAHPACAPVAPEARRSEPPAPPAEVPAVEAEAPAPAAVPVPEEPAPMEPATMSIERDEEEESVSPELEAARALIARGVEKAGSAPLLAEAIEHAVSALYSARSGTKPMSASLRAKIEAFLAEGAPARAEADEEEAGDEEAPASVTTWAARKPAPAAPRAKPAPVPTPNTPEPARSPGEVRLTLAGDAARDLYLLARKHGHDGVALALSDALLARAS